MSDKLCLIASTDGNMQYTTTQPASVLWDLYSSLLNKPRRKKHVVILLSSLGIRWQITLLIAWCSR